MGTLKFSTKKKYVRTDAWRGYYQPEYAIAGVNDTGNWSDSPSPSKEVNTEIHEFQKELKKLGVPTRKITAQTSNVFSVNHFLIPPVQMFPSAKIKVQQVLKKKQWRNVWAE